jgi:hypothetical protein
MRKSIAFFTPEVLTLLASAGWYEGRQAQGQFAVPSDVHYPAQIEQLLQEFGGLLIRSTGAGQTLARNSICFDPSYAEMESSEEGTLTYYSGLLQHTLYPLGHIPAESLLLCIDLAGTMYMAGDYLYRVGSSFAEGVSNILLGVKGEEFNERTLRWDD